MELFVMWFVSALAIGVAAFLLPGVTVTVAGALIAAVVLGLVNGLVKPIITLLTLPVNILTLGLFSFVVNGALILLVSAVVPGFHVPGFFTAVLFGVVLAVVHMVMAIF